jgi:octaprenyl-diphosphate synthase
MSSLHAAEAELPVGRDSGPNLDKAYAPVMSSLAKVEAILQRELRSDTPFVDQLLEHSWLLGGKRIRPVFLLLSGAASGNVNDSHFQLAAALEMIHTATLVHDDILDHAETRRHRPTANAKWGVQQSVLLGDYLFTHAFDVAAKGGSCEALQMLARASNRVCEGEMRQNAWQGNFDLCESDYLRMITEKTAELCGVGCRLGAFLSGASSTTVDQFETYGRNLGVAFQIVDDILDIVGRDQTVGKTLGTDLLNQKPTLPVIHCLENLSQADRSAFVNFLKANESTADQLVDFLEGTNSIEYARKRARDHANDAIEFASSLSENENSKALVCLGEFVLKRTY